MTLNADNVLVATTGAFYADTDGTATAPTGTASSLSSWGEEMGYVSDDGVSLKMPGLGDSTPLKAWQNGATVRKIHTPPDDVPQLTLTFIETKLHVIEFVFGVTITQTSTEGSFVINTTALREHVPCVLDVVDGSSLVRVYAPKAIITSIGEIKLTNTDEIGYQATLDLEYDATLAGQAKVWMTALKS
ncbi:MAG: hypothetical protein LCH43_11270 [Actinobacteria bacterium]|nr:hypothetical protein [Actinomycetota bacterium]